MEVGVREPKDEELVARVVRGDREALGILYDRMGIDVQRFLLGLQLDLDRQEIEDAVQETFLRLHRLLHQFEAGRPVKPYVLGVARRVALELERRRRPAPLEADPGREVEAGDELLRAERDALVGRALGALPGEHRTLVVFRFVNELTMQEIADAIACSVPTARARLKEAMVRFMNELARMGLAPTDVVT